MVQQVVKTWIKTSRFLASELPEIVEMPSPDVSHDQRGMTLVEVLVVLAIVAVMASLTVLAIGSGEGMTSQAEANRLQSRLQLAADRTMIDSEAIAFAPQANSYGFVRWDASKSALPAALGERHQLPDGMTLKVVTQQAENTPAQNGQRLLLLGADTSGEGFEIILSSRERNWTISFDGMTARTRPGPADAIGT